MSTLECANCGIDAPESELYYSEQGKICGSCQVELETDFATNSESVFVNPLSITGAIAGFLPFVFNLTSASERSAQVVIDGQVVQDTADELVLNYTALGGGGIALIVGVILGVQALGADDHPKQRWGVAGVILVLGVIQLLRGFGFG